MNYICKNCGKEHDGLPAIVFNSPFYYHVLDERDKEEMAILGSDLCVIRHSDQTDRFVRVVLQQKILGTCEVLEYGVWVSVSEKSFEDYRNNFDNKERETTYFGFLASAVLGYENTLSLKTNVNTQKDGERPIIIPHEADHPFVKDYFAGISWEEAIKRVRRAGKP